MAALEPPRTTPKVSFINDPFYRGIIYQALLMIALVLFLWWIVGNTTANLAAQRKTTGFDFLWNASGFPISFSLIPFERSSLYITAFFVGLLNTLLVAVIGIVFATIIGFAVGIARLSSNWLIARIATIYIELFRNMPLLLQLFFWYFAVLKAMPAVRDSLVLPLGAILNQRGLYLPRPMPDDRFTMVWVGLAIAVVAGLAVRVWAHRRLEATGQRFPVGLTFIGLLIVIPGALWVLTGAHLDFQLPELTGFNYSGGIALPPELVALVLGLTIYTAAFIAETVRAGIKAVSHGQTEAAAALGLREGDRLRLVIVPQALRVIIPPLTSQYLNLTKNSSLGAAIGFPELVNVFAGTTLNQTGRAIEVMALTMLVYLTFSLVTSMIMNWYNARIALVER